MLDLRFAVVPADQIASAANLLHNNVHVWDTRRPFVPVASFDGHRSPITGLEWLDSVPKAVEPFDPAQPPEVNDAHMRELPDSVRGQWLLTVSKDNTAHLQSVDCADRPHKGMGTAALSMGPTEISWAHDSIGTRRLWRC